MLNMLCCLVEYFVKTDRFHDIGEYILIVILSTVVIMAAFTYINADQLNLISSILNSE